MRDFKYPWVIVILLVSGTGGGFLFFKGAEWTPKRGSQTVASSSESLSRGIANVLENQSLEIEHWTQQGWKPVISAESPSEVEREFTLDQLRALEESDPQKLHVQLQSTTFGEDQVQVLEELIRTSRDSKTRWLSIEALGRAMGGGAQSALIRLYRSQEIESEAERRHLLGQIQPREEKSLHYLTELLSQGEEQMTSSEWQEIADRLVVFALAQGWSWERLLEFMQSTGSVGSEEVMSRMHQIWEKYSESTRGT